MGSGACMIVRSRSERCRIVVPMMTRTLRRGTGRRHPQLHPARVPGPSALFDRYTLLQRQLHDEIVEVRRDAVPGIRERIVCDVDVPDTGLGLGQERVVEKRYAVGNDAEV